MYPRERSKNFKYTADNFVKGSLVMSGHQSIRSLEFQNACEMKEKEEINAELNKMENEKNHLVVLESAIREWAYLLKDIQRLSKGVPLMKSIRLV